MLQSILVYTLTAIILYALGKHVAYRNAVNLRLTGKEIGFFCPEIIFSIVIFSFIAGVRYQVGVDHLSYLSNYMTFQKSGYIVRETLEPLYIFITQLFARNGIHFSFYFAFLASLQIGFIYYALRNDKNILPYIGICVMLHTFFLDWMNGIRQSIVMCAFVYAVEFIENRKLRYYLLFVIIASTMHKSAYLLIPIYFLFYKSFDLSNRKVNLAILFACVIIGAVPTWLGLLNGLDDILFLLGYEAYSEGIDVMTSENLRDMSWGPSRLSVFISECIIIWLYPQMKNFYHENRRLTIYFVLFFLGTCLYNLFANTSHIFLRPVSYFTIFRLPMLAYLLYYLIYTHKYFLFRFTIIVICIFTYWSIYKTSLISDTNVVDFVNYKFFWDYIY